MNDMTSSRTVVEPPLAQQSIADRIRELSQWLAETDIGLLELKTSQGRIRLVRDFEGSVVEDAGEVPASSDVASCRVVASSVGMFLRSHPLRDAPLVEDGEPIVAGQLVGLLRVGSLLLPVESPSDGVVGDWLVDDGSAVGYGTALLTLITS